MSYNERIRHLESRLGSQRSGCPHCGKPVLCVDVDFVGGPKHCIHCDGALDENDLPPGPITIYVGLREVRALI